MIETKCGFEFVKPLGFEVEKLFLARGLNLSFRNSSCFHGLATISMTNRQDSAIECKSLFVNCGFLAMCIIEDLRRNCADKKVKQLPRPQAALKYMLRLHLNINGLDFSKHLKQVQVRPAVLLHLLHFLIDRNHEVFRGKGTAEELYAQVAQSVEAEYLEEDSIPEALLKVIEEAQS